MPGKRTSKSKPPRKSATPSGSKVSRKSSLRPAAKQAPGFVINEGLEILEFLGHAAAYLRAAPGKATLHLRKMLRPDMQREVLALVEKARKAGSARKVGVPFLLGSEGRKVSIQVTRHKDRTSGQIRYQVLFEEPAARSGTPAKATRRPKGEQRTEPKAVGRRQKITTAKDSYGSMLAKEEQEHKVTLEELRTANEELHETAARLGVANAELEASQAELEATAEDLRVTLEESERREKRLRESESRVRALLETAAQGILAVGPNGRIALVNGTAEKMFGYRREELLGQSVEILVPGGRRTVHQRHRQEFFAHPRTRPMGQGIDLFAQRKNGTTFPVEISLSHTGPEGEMVAVAFVSDITERKRAEQSLRESEARFRHLADNAPVLIWVSGPDKKCTWFNKPWLEFTGRSIEQELGDGWTEGVHPKDIDRCLRTCVIAFNARKLFTMEYRLRRADGQYRWVLDTGVPQFAGSEFTGYIGSCIDITERKQAETELSLQVAITANMTEGISLVRTRDAVIVYANGRYHELFGYEPGELHGRPVTVLNAGSRAEAQAVAREIVEVLHRDHVWKGEVRNVRKDGSVFWSSTTVSTLEHDEYGTVWLGVLRDVTDRKKAETDLREEYAFNAALVDTVRALVVVFDREGQIVRFNKACQEVTGYSFGEVQGHKVWEFLLIPEEVGPVKRVFRGIKARRLPSEFENYWVTKAGQRRLIGWVNTALSDDNGKVRFVIGTGIDITEHRQMEKTIRRSHSELRRLTARLTSVQEEEYKHLSRELHDVFSQKLTMLGMHVSELEQKLSAAGLATGEDFGQIGAQISDLATQIHGISRRLHPAILDDLGLAAALKNECFAFTREYGSEVTFHSEGRYEAIPSNVALCLYRIAQESLTNIRKHSQADRVDVHLVGAPEEIVLSIEDFGKGFDPNQVRGRGGLGLVSMEERIRLVNGELAIRSKPGDGTTVQVRVPLEKATRRRPRR
jgi:PAS domain S-box-containing protein